MADKTPQTVTVEAWVYPTNLNGWRNVVIKEAPNYMVYSLYANQSAPKPGATASISSVEYSVTASGQLPLNTWSHLAITIDGTALRLFVNGTQVKSTAASGTLTPSANPLRIGGNTVWGEYFSGKIDEVRIYNRALSAAEIKADMNTAVVP